MSLDSPVIGTGAVRAKHPNITALWLTCVAFGQLARPRKGLRYERPNLAANLDPIIDRAAKMNPAQIRALPTSFVISEKLL